MKADQLDNARNPLLPAAMEAIQRAARQALQKALRTHTAIVIEWAGRTEWIEWYRLNDSIGGYPVSS